MKIKMIVITAVASALIAGTATVTAGDREDAMAQAQQALQALGMGTEPGAKVEAINWRKLAKLLPKEIDGMESGKLDGGTFNIGGQGMAGLAALSKSKGDSADMPDFSMSYSTVERSYTQKLDNGKKKKLTIRIMDSGMARLMLQPYMMAVEYDTPEGMLKSTKIGDYPAKLMLEFDDDLEVTKTQYMVLVSDRILAQFDGNGNATQDEVEALATGFPFAEIEKLAQQAKAAPDSTSN